MVIGGDCYPPHQYPLVIVQQGNTLTGGAFYATERGAGNHSTAVPTYYSNSFITHWPVNNSLNGQI